jgi:hypothetical protein
MEGIPCSKERSLCITAHITSFAYSSPLLKWTLLIMQNLNKIPESISKCSD